MEPLEGYRQSAYTGCKTGGHGWVEVLPIVIFGETGKQVMALHDSGCNTTLIDESLAFSLELLGKQVDLKIQGVNVQKEFLLRHFVITTHFVIRYAFCNKDCGALK